MLKCKHGVRSIEKYCLFSTGQQDAFLHVLSHVVNRIPIFKAAYCTTGRACRRYFHFNTMTTFTSVEILFILPLLFRLFDNYHSTRCQSLKHEKFEKPLLGTQWLAWVLLEIKDHIRVGSFFQCIDQEKK